ncbi:hypothetical protein POJ06DRAFT_147775 [Lipomyces tetrasporus]|uniref:Uncharacterized protein n=1 Tax=Lipomyces tetrasporus TaxID=54092 RepID=A0AAD7VRL3_9ASCO|nr:uncharacterized protein POJ06DRAFT_147775 [Lipomyces tetrasporus]KAJ8098245.1 hypothetical protein POJ06DRAFT_147775 [Lipomyces tetrasporus]
MLWKPIKRLLKKAQAAYQEAATKREFQIGDIAAQGVAQPLPYPLFDLSQMAINEYNPSLLFGSCAPVDPQVPTLNPDWQRFLMDSEASDSIEENAFEAWPFAFDAP